MANRLTSILDIYPLQVENKFTHWTCGGGGGGGGFLVCCGGSGVHLEAGSGAFPVERGGIGVRFGCVPRQRRQIRFASLRSRLLLFILTFGIAST